MKFCIKYTYASVIVHSTIMRTQTLLENIFIKWTSIPARLESIVQKVHKPTKNQRDYYSGKHKMRCINTQAIVISLGLLMNHSHFIPCAQHYISHFMDS